MHDDIGRGPILALIFSSGALASLASLLHYTLRKEYHVTTLGASGIVCALVAASCVLHEG